MKGRTVLVIAHRLSTIKNADLVAVISKGTIVEQGKHNQLIRDKKGIYYKLASRQLEGPSLLDDVIEDVDVDEEDEDDDEDDEEGEEVGRENKDEEDVSEEDDYTFAPDKPGKNSNSKKKMKEEKKQDKNIKTTTTNNNNNNNKDNDEDDAGRSFVDRKRDHSLEVRDNHSSSSSSERE